MQTRKLGLRGLALAFAGVLTLGLAACDDTETVPPATQATITVSPTGTVDLLVGQTFQVVASVQNGAGGNNNVTYSSSNTAVATVDANGTVRAVAPGVATITAASAADANVRAAVVVRVTAPTQPGGPVQPPAGQQDSARVVISSIVDADNNPVNETNASGTFFVRLDVTPGRADSLTVSLGDNTVCRQTFNAASGSEASASGISASAASAEFVCAVNSAATTNGQPRFANGATTITARLFDNNAVIASASRAVTLNNANAVGASVAATDTTISPETGLRWFDGDLIVTVTPRIFSGSTTVSRVTVSLNAEDNEGDDFDLSETDETATDGTFSVTFDGEDLEGLTDDDLDITISSVTTAGGEGPTNSLSIRYDNEAPEGGVLTGQAFIGADVEFEDLVDEDAIDDEDGVGGVTVRFFVGDTGDFDDVETLEDVEAAGTEVETGKDLENADMSGEFDLIAVVCDALDNCDVLDAFTFETDFVAPTFDVAVDDTLIFGVGDATTGTIEVDVEDDVSGFEGPGLLVSGTRTFRSGTSTVTRCVIGDEVTEANFEAAFQEGEDFDDFNGTGEVGSADSTCEPVIIESAIPVPDATGYYVFTIRAIDVAGNVSEDAETVNVLVDQVAPSVDDIDFSANLEGGDTETFSAELNDNLDLDGYSVAINYGGFGELPLTGIVNVDNTFGAPLTVSADVTASTFFVESISEDTDAGEGITIVGDFEADEVVVRTFDHAFNTSADGRTAIAQTFGANSGFADDDVTGYDVTVDGSNNTICVEAGCDDGTESKTLRATISEDLSSDSDSPIDRVYFYVRAPADAGGFTFRLVGIDETASTSVTTTERNFVYTTSLTTEELQGLGIEEDETVTVVGIAVDEDGVGVAEFNTELTAQED